MLNSSRSNLNILSKWNPASGWKTLFSYWLEERFPNGRQITLSLNKIFIVPTLTGTAMLATIALLYLLAINFQSSLIYALSFWLIALFIIAIFFTYKNLAGITIKAVRADSCFAGEKAVFELEISCPENLQKSSFFLGWRDQDIIETHLVEHHCQRIKLSHETLKRGYFKPERVSVFSRYPLNLLISWSYAPLDMHAIVYPEPKLMDQSESGLSVDDEAAKGNEIANGSADFAGIRDYQTGDSPKQIHWGSYAKTGRLYTKSFIDYASKDIWLEWDTLNIQGIEAKLSHLSAQILSCFQEDQIYGLKIPSKTIQPSKGEAHKTICLTALALYGLDS